MRPGASENVPQGSPLAIIPYGAIGCTLEQFESEAAAAGVPDRLDYSVIGQSEPAGTSSGSSSTPSRPPRSKLPTPAGSSFGSSCSPTPRRPGPAGVVAASGLNVKLPIFVEANIHGGEREGTDAMMQVIRDLVTLPHGTNDTVDDLLDNAILVVIPTTNPDGRVAGRRQNENRFDLNRDLLVQSQPEIRANTAFQLEWLAPVGLFMHGYYNPTLVDGLTKPHNPGLEYDKFLYWNQRRLDANEAAIEGIGRTIQRPVNQWDARGVSGSKNGGPGGRRGLGRLGPVLQPDVRRVLRRRRLDGRDVRRRSLRRPAGIEARAVPHLLLVGPLLAREQERDPRRPAGDLPARRDRRGPGELLRRPVGRRPGLHGGPAQLDGRVPQGLPDPVRRRVGRPGLAPPRGPAKRRRGEPARPVAA